MYTVFTANAFSNLQLDEFKMFIELHLRVVDHSQFELCSKSVKLCQRLASILCLNIICARVVPHDKAFSMNVNLNDNTWNNVRVRRIHIFGSETINVINCKYFAAAIVINFDNVVLWHAFENIDKV